MFNYFDTNYLIGVLEKTMPLKTFCRMRFFDTAHPEPSPSQTVSFEYQAGNMRLAPYTSERHGGVATESRGYEVRTYRTPYLVPSRVITNDILMQKMLGESPFNSGMTPEARAAQIAARTVMELQDKIQRREEYMCARCLQDGELLIDGPGVHERVDYGFTGIETVEAADKWTVNFDIPGYLGKRAQGLRKKGSNANILVLGTDAANALLANKSVTKLMDMRRVEAGEINPGEIEAGVQYLGRLSIPGLYVDMYSYDAYYEDEDGTAQPYFDPDTAMLISDRDKGLMLYGAVTYIDGKTGEYRTASMPYVPYKSWSVNPPVQELFLASRPLPMPRDLTSWCVMKQVV